jgi:hypothetical protein
MSNANLEKKGSYAGDISTGLAYKSYRRRQKPSIL